MSLRALLSSLLVLWVSGLGLVGCEDEVPTPAPSPTPTPVPTPVPVHYSVKIYLDYGPWSAGQPVPYLVQVLADPGGDVTRDATILMEVDPADGVTQEVDKLSFTMAGAYTVYARATIEGQQVIGSAVVGVVAGPVAGVRVTVSPNPAPAGATAITSAALVDTWGNVVSDGISAVYEINPTGVVEVNGATLRSELAGTYEVIGTNPATGLTGSTTWVVDPLEPIDLRITLSSDRIKPEESITALAEGIDRYGNPIPINADWTVIPTDGVRVSGGRFTFSEEGFYRVLAEGISPDGQTLEGEEGPVVVDGTLPNLILTAPDRASYQESPTVDIIGNAADYMSGLGDVTINGISVGPLSGDGTFLYPYTPREGLNVLQVLASDLNGNTTEWVQSFLWASEWTPVGGRVEQAFYGRMAQPTIDELALYLTDYLDPAEMEAYLLSENPLLVYEDEYEVCIFGNCTQYHDEIYLNFLDLSYSNVVTTMIPHADEGDGYLEIGVFLDNLSSTIEAYGTFAGLDIDPICGVLNTDFGNAVGTARVTFDSDGKSHVLFDSAMVELKSFDIETCDGSYSNVMDAIDDEVEKEMEDLLVDLIFDEVPPLLEDLLDGMILHEAFDVEEVPITLDAALSSMTFDDTGSTLSMWSEVETVPFPELAQNPGTLKTPSLPPTFGSSEFYLSGADDLLNQLLYTLWAGGVLHLTYTDEDLGFTPEQLDLLFNGATQMEMRLAPPLPPVLMPAAADAGYLMDAGLGDTVLEVWTDAYTGGQGELALDYSLAVSLVCGANASAPSPNVLSVTFANISVLLFQVLQQPAERPLPEETLEQLLVLASDELLGYLNSFLEVIPIPTVEGYGVAVTEITMSGPERDFLSIGGALIPPVQE